MEDISERLELRVKLIANQVKEMNLGLNWDEDKSRIYKWKRGATDSEPPLDKSSVNSPRGALHRTDYA